MSLDPQLWQRLQDHGVTEEHLGMLLAVLDLQRQGSWTWSYVRGQIVESELKMKIPARSRAIHQTATVLTQAVGPSRPKAPR